MARTVRKIVEPRSRPPRPRHVRGKDAVTTKQVRFIQEFEACGDPDQAALIAGYSDLTPSHKRDIDRSMRNATYYQRTRTRRLASDGTYKAVEAVIAALPNMKHADMIRAASALHKITTTPIEEYAGSDGGMTVDSIAALHDKASATIEGLLAELKVVEGIVEPPPSVWD